MKTLVLSDLLSQRSSLGQMAFILVVVDIIMLISMQSPEAALAGVAVMVTSSIFIILKWLVKN